MASEQDADAGATEAQETVLVAKITKLKSFARDVYLAMSHQETAETKEKSPPANLSRKVLSTHAKRFSSALEPYVYYFRRIRGLLFWQNFYETLLVSVVYWFCVFNQTFLLALLLWAIGLLVRAMLRRKGVLYSAPGKPQAEEQDSSSFLDKLRQAKTVTQQVQNGLGAVADVLERLSNLLSFRAQQQSSQLLYVLSGICLALVILPSSWVFATLETAFYIKFFVLEAIYFHFPHLKERYDKPFFSSLPTNLDLEQQDLNEFEIIAREDELSPDSDFDEFEDATETRDGRSNSLKAKAVDQLEKIGIAATEDVLGAWASLDVSEGSVFKAKRGRIVLTSKYFIFLRNSETESTVFPLSALKQIQRAKPIGFVAKKGFALEIKVEATAITRSLSNSTESSPAALKHSTASADTDGAGDALQLKRGASEAEAERSSSSSVELKTLVYAILQREEVYTTICRAAGIAATMPNT